MPRSLTLPRYARSTVASGSIYNASTATGSESAATTASWSSLSNQQKMLLPEGAAPNEALPATDVSSGKGWRFDAAVNADDPVIFAAGTFTLFFSYARASTVLHVDGDVTHTFILHVVDSNGDVRYEVGRNTVVVTLTTTVQTASVSVTTASSIELEPGDRFQWEIGVQRPALAGATNGIWRTNGGSNAMRISAAPTYTTQYVRGLADSAPAGDALARGAGYARALGDDAEITDVLTRVAAFPRALADDAPVAADTFARVFTGARALADSPVAVDAIARQFDGARSLTDGAGIVDALARQFDGARALADQVDGPADTLTRQFTGARTLNDSPAVTDAITRSFTGARSLADSAGLADAVTRQFDGARQLADSIDAVTDVLERQFTANRAVADAVDGATDALARQFTGARALTDAPTVTDSLSRAATFSRDLEDALAEGGAEIPAGILRLRPDGRVEAVNSGSVPPGALRIVSYP